MEKELEEGYIVDTYGNTVLKEDCVELWDGEICLRDEAIFCEDDEQYYEESNYSDHSICYVDAECAYYFEDNCLWGETENGEGWMHQDCEYVYSEYSERYFSSASVANGCEFYYVERVDDYLHLDDDNGSDDEVYDGQFFVESKRYNETHGMKYSFGVELETCEGYLDYNSKLSLDCVDDGSIDGKEYVTGVLYGNKGVHMLEKICNELSEQCYVDKTCGIHVHIGGANFNRRFSMLSVMLGQMIQDEAFECMPVSRRKNTYCVKIHECFKEMRVVSKKQHPFTHKHMLRLLNNYVYGTNDDFNKNNCKSSRHPNGRYASTRYKWLNLNNCSYNHATPNTVEFRLHSGSLDFNKVYNWVVFCMAFVNFVENHSRTIINEYDSYLKGVSTISMRNILTSTIGEIHGNVIANYYQKRRDKFI